MYKQDKKETGEAIPQAITSGLWLYNHHDLQVKKFLTHTLLYNLQLQHLSDLHRAAIK